MKDQLKPIEKPIIRVQLITYAVVDGLLKIFRWMMRIDADASDCDLAGIDGYFGDPG